MASRHPEPAPRPLLALLLALSSTIAPAAAQPFAGVCAPEEFMGASAFKQFSYTIGQVDGAAALQFEVAVAPGEMGWLGMRAAGGDATDLAGMDIIAVQAGENAVYDFDNATNNAAPVITADTAARRTVLVSYNNMGMADDGSPVEVFTFYRPYAGGGVDFTIPNGEAFTIATAVATGAVLAGGAVADAALWPAPAGENVVDFTFTACPEMDVIFKPTAEPLTQEPGTTAPATAAPAAGVTAMPDTTAVPATAATAAPPAVPDAGGDNVTAAPAGAVTASPDEEWVDDGTPNHAALILGCIYLALCMFMLGFILMKLFSERKWVSQMVRSELEERHTGAGAGMSTGGGIGGGGRRRSDADGLYSGHAHSVHALKFWGITDDDADDGDGRGGGSGAAYHAMPPSPKGGGGGGLTGMVTPPHKKRGGRKKLAGFAAAAGSQSPVNAGTPALIILADHTRGGEASMAAAVRVAQRMGAGAVKCLSDESGEPATRAAVLGGLRWLTAAARKDTPALLMIIADHWEDTYDASQGAGGVAHPLPSLYSASGMFDFAPEDAPPPQLATTGFKPADFFEAGPVRASEILAELQHGLSEHSSVGIIYDVPSPAPCWSFPHLMTPLDCTPPAPAARSNYPPQAVVALAMFDDTLSVPPGALVNALDTAGLRASSCVDLLKRLNAVGAVADDGAQFPIVWSNRFLDDTEGCTFPYPGAARSLARARGYSPPRQWAVTQQQGPQATAPPPAPPMRTASLKKPSRGGAKGERPQPVWFANLQHGNKDSRAAAAAAATGSPRSELTDGGGGAGASSPWLQHPPTFAGGAAANPATPAAGAPVWGTAAGTLPVAPQSPDYPPSAGGAGIPAGPGASAFPNFTPTAQQYYYPPGHYTAFGGGGVRGSAMFPSPGTPGGAGGDAAAMKSTSPRLMHASAGSPRRSVSPGAMGLSEQLYHFRGGGGAASGAPPPPERTNCLLRSPAPNPCYTYRKATLRTKTRADGAWVFAFAIEGEPQLSVVPLDSIDRCGAEPAASTDYPNQTLFLAPYDQPRLVLVLESVRLRDTWISWVHAQRPESVVILPTTFSMQP